MVVGSYTKKKKKKKKKKNCKEKKPSMDFQSNLDISKLDKSNSRYLEQICWSLDSLRYRELTVLKLKFP